MKGTEFLQTIAFHGKNMSTKNHGKNWDFSHSSSPSIHSHSHPMPPQGIIDLIQAKTMSIFTLLDEECRMPKAGEELGDMVDPPKPGIMVCF